MSAMAGMLRAGIFAAAAAALLPLAAATQDFPDKDAREIGAYVLTEAGLARYAKASANLEKLGQNPSGDCETESASSLDESAARLDAVPGVKAAIQSAGMATREYVVFTWSLFQNAMAAWALSQPGGGDTCDDRSDETDEE